MVFESVKFVETENSAIQDELNINPDEFLVEGVKKYTLDLNLNARYLDRSLSKIKEITNLNEKENSKFVTKVIVSCKLK